jgi:hypothetical protein
MAATDLEYTLPTDELPATWTLTNGVAAAGYLPAALTNDNPADPYKVDSTYIRLVTDLGTARPVAVAALIHPNFAPGFGPVLLQGGHLATAGNLGSFTADVTVPFQTPAYGPDQFPYNLAADLRPAAPSYRYWSLVTGDGTSSGPQNTVPISLGELKLYTAVHALDGSLGLDLSPVEEEGYPLIDHATDGDVTMVYPLGTKRRWLRGGVVQFAAAAPAVQAWYRSARGRCDPFVLLVTDAEGGPVPLEPWFVRFESVTLGRALTYGSVASTFELGFEEISRGLRPTPAAV